MLGRKYDALRDLLLLVQFEKREKYRWMSVTFSEEHATVLKLTLHGCF